MADETRDISGMEQMAIVVRYVDIHQTDFSIQEYFLT